MTLNTLLVRLGQLLAMLAVLFLSSAAMSYAQGMVPAEKLQGFSATDVVTIFAALGVLITGVGAVIVNIIVAMRAGQKLEQSLVKTDALIGQVKEVHTLTNSNLSAVTSKLDTATGEIAALKSLVQDLKSERELTRSAAAAIPVVSQESAKAIPVVVVNEPLRTEPVKGSG